MKKFSRNELYSILSSRCEKDEQNTLLVTTNVMESLSNLCESIFMNYIGDSLIKETNGKINIPKRRLPEDIAKGFALLMELTIMDRSEKEVEECFNKLILSYKEHIKNT